MQKILNPKKATIATWAVSALLNSLNSLTSRRTIMNRKIEICAASGRPRAAGSQDAVPSLLRLARRNHPPRRQEKGWVYFHKLSGRHPQIFTVHRNLAYPNLCNHTNENIQNYKAENAPHAFRIESGSHSGQLACANKRSPCTCKNPNSNQCAHAT